MIQFLHAGEIVQIEDFASDTSVLMYLREHRRLTGTKEGCAAGDCGACTVVTAHATHNGQLCYQPLNACIAPLGCLDRKQLITVEELKHGEAWHPVQRAMIEGHGSQCGFCTPGFIMSMFALYHSDGTAHRPTPDRQQIVEALGGNLCRCTGYRPIIDAAQRALTMPAPDQFSAAEAHTIAQLKSLGEQRADTPALNGDQGRYFRPESAQGIADLLAEHPDARLIAGGTDLFLEVTQKLQRLPLLIDVCAASDLRAVSVDDATIRLGAGVTHRHSREAVLHDYPELAELIERFGSLQIRSQGTVVGNLASASPIGDWSPVLLALTSRLVLRNRAGSREISIDDFFIDYRKTALKAGEFIESVVIPRRPEELFLRAYKISKRFEDDISSLCMVVALTLSGDKIVNARVACGGMAATPKRALHCEAALRGLNLSTASIAAAAAALDSDFTPISDFRASATYRSHVARNLLTRLQLEFRGDCSTRSPGSGAEIACRAE